LTLTTLPWKWSRLLLGRLLLTAEIRRSGEAGREKIFSFWPVVFVPPFSWIQVCRINWDRLFGASEEHVHAKIYTYRQPYGIPVTTFI
jgi:hypothetical protein